MAWEAEAIRPPCRSARRTAPQAGDKGGAQGAVACFERNQPRTMPLRTAPPRAIAMGTSAFLLQGTRENAVHGIEREGGIIEKEEGGSKGFNREPLRRKTPGAAPRAA